MSRPVLKTLWGRPKVYNTMGKKPPSSYFLLWLLGFRSELTFKGLRGGLSSFCKPLQKWNLWEVIGWWSILCPVGESISIFANPWALGSWWKLSALHSLKEVALWSFPAWSVLTSVSCSSVFSLCFLIVRMSVSIARSVPSHAHHHNVLPMRGLDKGVTSPWTDTSETEDPKEWFPLSLPSSCDWSWWWEAD